MRIFTKIVDMDIMGKTLLPALEIFMYEFSI